MAIKNLIGIEKLGDCEVIDMELLKETWPEMFNESGSMDCDMFWNNVRPTAFIYVMQEFRSILFTIKDTKGHETPNGCSVTAMLHAVRAIICGNQMRMPNTEHIHALMHIDSALALMQNDDMFVDAD